MPRSPAIDKRDSTSRRAPFAPGRRSRDGHRATRCTTETEPRRKVTRPLGRTQTAHWRAAGRSPSDVSANPLAATHFQCLPPEPALFQLGFRGVLLRGFAPRFPGALTAAGCSVHAVWKHTVCLASRPELESRNGRRRVRAHPALWSAPT